MLSLPLLKSKTYQYRLLKMDKVSYALGLGIGQQLSDMGAQSLNIDDFSQAIKDVIAGAKPKIDNQEAQALVQIFFQEQEKKQRAAAEEKGKVVKEAGEAYLAENAKKEGVVTLPSGLQYIVLKEGNGKKPTAADQVTCHYEGMLYDGTPVSYTHLTLPTICSV